MRAQLRAWIACVGVAYTGVALAAPPGARESYQRAKQLDDNGDSEQALGLIQQALDAAPKDLALLGLRAAVLFQLRDYPTALMAYQAYLDAGATGRSRREAQKRVEELGKLTFLDVVVGNASGTVYLESKTLGVFCAAQPMCHKAILPSANKYKVIVEQPGFERWTGEVLVEEGKTARLDVTLIEKSSQLTVRATPADATATITVDGAPYHEPVTIPAGRHTVEVASSGYSTVHRMIDAHEGRPVELEVPLEPLAPRVAVTAPVSGAPGGERSQTRMLLGLGIAAAGGVAVGVGLAFGAKARSTDADVTALCGSDHLCDSTPDYERGHQLASDAKSQATTATVLIAAGGAAAVAGVIVWLTAPREHAPRTARIVPVIGGASDVGLAVVGGF